MLLHLHVRDLALIREEEVSFTDGLNILTGETGAGKSIIIGSVNLALGGKADKGIIRTGADHALIEMIFSLDNDQQRELLSSMDLPAEDDTVLIKRKIMPGRSICSVCGETVTLHQMREIAECLLDVYGQRENQRLLRREAQLSSIDAYAGEEAEILKQKVRSSFSKWKELSREYEKNDLDTAARRRERDLLLYEIGEIEEAAVKEGEEEELETVLRRLSAYQKIMTAAGTAAECTGAGDNGRSAGAADSIGRAVRELTSVQGYDDALDSIAGQLSEVEQLLSDLNRELQSYLMDLTFDPEQFAQVQDRLAVIGRMKDKYGRLPGEIEQSLIERKSRLEFLEDYENRRAALSQDVLREREILFSLCGELSALRRKAAEEFGEKLRAVLPELNFLQADFRAELSSGEEYLTENGWDRAAFFISMNPGEEPRHLEQIASGGELSRIMLGIKTVFAGKEDIHTFIFDEIDTGISGQTAWKVAQKLGRLAGDHQILCITHLPQIAAMGDSHYLISKESGDGRTQTHIARLNEAESERELARLLGGETITEATLENAREMKAMAAASSGR